MASRKRRPIAILAALLVLALAAGVFVFGYNTKGNSERFLYIPTGSTYADVKAIMAKEDILLTVFSFDLLARAAKYPERVRPGRYRVTPHMSNYALVRMLRNGSQAPVKLVINKLRTKQDLVRFVDAQLEADSVSLAHILADSTYLAGYGLDTNNAMCIIIPDTYEFYWNTTAAKFFEKIGRNYNSFWTDARKQQATAKQLTTIQSTIIASIVEEETNMATDKPLIASVYLNRLSKGMPLQADPTIKFALGDFAIKRVTGAHLSVISPYNTYDHADLPPGPICTPSKKTIDVVLQSPSTEYLYFCAREDLSGYSNFATNLTDHLKNARAYQQALNARGIH